MKNRDGEIYKQNNKGLSIVEMIVVIAIMSVMLGIIGYSISMLFSAEARQAANKTVASLNDAKTGAMSRGGEYMVIAYEPSVDEKKGIDKAGYYACKKIYYIDNDAPSIIKDSPQSGDEYSKIGSKKVTITINGTDIDKDTQQIVFRFDRVTGELKSAKVIDLTDDAASAAKSDVVDFSEIVFKSGLREYKVKIESVTGSISITN